MLTGYPECIAICPCSQEGRRYLSARDAFGEELAKGPSASWYVSRLRRSPQGRVHSAFSRPFSCRSIREGPCRRFWAHVGCSCLRSLVVGRAQGRIAFASSRVATPGPWRTQWLVQHRHSARRRHDANGRWVQRRALRNTAGLTGPEAVMQEFWNANVQGLPESVRREILSYVSAGGHRWASLGRQQSHQSAATPPRVSTASADNNP